VLDYLLHARKTELLQLMRSQDCFSFEVLLDLLQEPSVYKFLWNFTGEVQEIDISEQIFGILVHKLQKLVSVHPCQVEVASQILDLMSILFFSVVFFSLHFVRCCLGNFNCCVT
jgi:hypothetical protein